MEDQPQFDLPLVADAGGGCPLYGSASHGLPDEQLGHQLRVEQSSSGDLPWSWAWGVPRMQKQLEPPALGVWGAGGGAGLGIPSSSGCCSQTWFHGLGGSPMALLKELWEDSAVRQDVLRLQGLEALGNPFPTMWGQLLCSIALALLGGRRKVLL